MTTNLTLDGLRRDNESALAAAAARRKRAHSEAHAILGDAERAGRSHLTAGEDNRLAQLGTQRRSAEEQIAKLEAARATIDEAVASELAYARDNQQVHATGVQLPTRAYDQVARVGMAERVYRPDEDPTGSGFLLDVSRSFLFGDVSAGQRLGRHIEEGRVDSGGYTARAAGTGAFSGLTVPQYLTNLYAPATAALRPFADAHTRHPLPADGMSLNISRITTTTGVALQASENSAVQETNIDDTLLTIPVQTIAGQQTLSRQSIERGTGVEGVVMNDLMRQHATRLDYTLINQATTGAIATGGTTSYVDSSPTGSELYPNICAAQSQLEQALLGLAVPDYLVCHSRRWNWLCSQMSSSWPLISDGDAVVPPQAGGIRVSNQYGSGVRGVLPNGLRVIVDNNLPTTAGGGTEDQMILFASGEAHLWESNGPLFIRAEQSAAASLGVLIVIYSYVAYTYDRFASNPQIIGGSGLAQPAGF